MEFIFENFPFWLLDLVPLFLFSLASLFIFKLRSKTVVILLITVSALIAFYLLDFISMSSWENLKESVVSRGDIYLIESYSIKSEEAISTFLAILKAVVLWLVALIYFITK